MNIRGYFMEDGIYFQGKKQPPRKMAIISIDCGDKALDELNDNDNIKVLSNEENWYTIKKKEILYS